MRWYRRLLDLGMVDPDPPVWGGSSDNQTVSKGFPLISWLLWLYAKCPPPSITCWFTSFDHPFPGFRKHKGNRGEKDPWSK